MRIILLTAPTAIPGEVETITEAIDRGEVDLLHFRRPGLSTEEAAGWLRSLPSRVLSRTVLHDHHELIRHLPELYGLHLNSRHPRPPQGYYGRLSRACHSLEEVRRYRDECDYLFLSPVFDSISKEGYRSGFTLEELERAAKEGLITDKVYALGGVTPEKYPLLDRLGFGGAALLGAFWEEV